MVSANGVREVSYPRLILDPPPPSSQALPMRAADLREGCAEMRVGSFGLPPTGPLGTWVSGAPPAAQSGPTVDIR